MSTTLRDSPGGSDFMIVELALAIDTNPGIGVELESAGVVMNNYSEKATNPSHNDELRVKGAAFDIVDNEEANALCTGPNWHVTAEYEDNLRVDGIARLRPEIIINGARVKLGTGQLAAVGKEIVDFMGLWRPQRDQKIVIRGFESFGPWMLTKPSTYSPEGVLFSVQITAAASLSAVQRYFSWAKQDPRPPGKAIYSVRSRKLSMMHLVRPKDFQAFTPNLVNIPMEVLGFFSLIVSYTKAARRASPEEGPKHSIPIMPRTDLATMYVQFIEPKISRQLAGDPNGLYEIVRELAKKPTDGSSGEDHMFNIDETSLNWTALKVRIGEEIPSGIWPEQVECLKSGQLPIKIWLRELQNNRIDLMTLMDQLLRTGQIGGLGSRMERLLTTSATAPYPVITSGTEAPIWEFRDIDGVNVNQIAQGLKEWEASIISMHLA